MKRSFSRAAYSLIGKLPTSVKRRLIRLVSDKFMVGVIGVVWNQEAQILVLEHTYRPGFRFGLPSGVLRRREAIEKSIPREVEEETGLKVGFERIIAVETNESPRRLDFWIECKLIGGQFRASAEVVGAQFMTVPEAQETLPEVQGRFLERHFASRG